MNTARNTRAISGTLIAAVALAGVTLTMATSSSAADYVQTNLVTDSAAALAASNYSPAVFVDPSLVNPWGMDHAPGGPWVVANAGFPTSGATGPRSVVTGYNGQGVKTPLSIISTQAGAGGSAGLTGLAYNGGTGFLLPDGSPATYLFSNLDGSISGWNAGEGANAVQVVAGRAGGNPAKYSGMELSDFKGATYLYAANHQTGAVDVFDTNFAPHAFGASAFVDPNADGLLAYNVESLGDDIFVTYAAASASNQLPGSGFVDEFTGDGQLIQRFASGGFLDSPWAVTLAPSDFGAYSGDVLIGNFTHNVKFGYISAYSTDGVFQGRLSANGAPIAIDGLWELAFGDGGDSGPTNALYFAAGINNEAHGLFGEISSVPEPATWALMLLGFGAMGARLRSARQRAMALG